MVGEPAERPKEAARIPRLQGAGNDSERPISSLGVAALALGTVGLALFWVPFVGQALSVAAVVFGWMGLRQVSVGSRSGRGLALAGLILGVLGLLVLAFLLLIGTMIAS